jgi:hypothetical protein
MRFVTIIWALGLMGCATTPSGGGLGMALADTKGPNTFCTLNPEGCAGVEEPAAPDGETCKAVCWERYEHNKQHCEELRHEPAAYRRCVIAAGLLLSGCLALCKGLAFNEPELAPRVER